MDAKVPFVDLAAQRARLGAGLDDAILGVLAHGQFVNGPEIGELEAVLADRARPATVVACASGTDALVMALLAAGVEPGDGVVVPSFTFAATAGAAALLGAVPVFADVDEHTFNMGPAGAAAAADWARAQGLRVRAVIAVDLYGQPADAAGIADAIGDRSRLVVDAAQSIGGSRGGVAVGALAPITTASFFPSKPLGCYGDGGAVLTTDSAIDATLRSIRQHGMGSDRYEHLRIGINGRLDSIQAAVLLQKLSIFDDELRVRAELAEAYTSALDDVVRCPVLEPGCTSAWAQYTIRVPDRAAVIASLAAEGVPTAVHYPQPLHRQPAFARYPVASGGAPVADVLAHEVLSLPMHPYLGDADRERVIEAVRRAVRSADAA